MIEFEVQLASSGVVERGGSRVLITKEAIQSIPQQLNGPRAVPHIVNHDISCMPIGKLRGGEVIEQNGELVATAYIQQENTFSQFNHVLSGIDLVRLDFAFNPKPFVRSRYSDKEHEQISVVVDLANFNSPDEYEEFQTTVVDIDPEFVCEIGNNRHALVPEATIIILLSAWVLKQVGKFTSYTIDETLKKVGDELSDDLSDKILQLYRSFKRKISHKDGNITTQLVINDEFQLNLLIKADVETVATKININKLADEIARFDDLMNDADNATFELTRDGDWRLLYLTTLDGKAIGTKHCFDSTIAEYERVTHHSDVE